MKKVDFEYINPSISSRIILDLMQFDVNGLKWRDVRSNIRDVIRHNHDQIKWPIIRSIQKIDGNLKAFL